MCYEVKVGRSASNKGVGINRGNPKLGSAGTHPFEMGAMIDPLEIRISHVCYRAEFYSF